MNTRLNRKSNECLFCTSRKCYEAVVCVEHNFVEISCINHVKELYEYSDKVLGINNGVLRQYISRCGSPFTRHQLRLRRLKNND